MVVAHWAGLWSSRCELHRRPSGSVLAEGAAAAPSAVRVGWQPWTLNVPLPVPQDLLLLLFSLKRPVQGQEAGQDSRGRARLEWET